NTIGGQIAACKKNNIFNMELRGFGPELNINNLTVEQAKEMKAEIDADKIIKVSLIGSGYGKINIKDDFEPHFEAFKNTVEVAKILEAKYIRMFSFFIDKDEDPEQYRDEVIRRVKIMADYADENGLICCHENEKGIYGDTAERCLDILKACDGKLKAVFDPANFVQCGVDTLKAYELLEEYIEYMHIKDALFADGKVVPAGEGEGNVEEIISRLAKQSRAIVLTLEPHLQVFDGLNNLESDDETRKAMDKGVYASHDESFKVASDAMHSVVEKIQPIRFGIIGMGNMGSAHARNFLYGKIKEMRVTAVADIVPEKLEWAKKNLPWAKQFDSAEALMESGEVDAVVICTPHYFHPPLVIKALQNNLHVVSEKPAGVYTKQVMEMNEIAKKSDHVFAMMFNQRTNCVYRKIKEIVDSKEYGEIKRVNWIITDWYRTQSYYNSGGWRATWAGEGGGVLLNQSPHQLDLWQWICGMPSKIRAFCHEGKWHDIEVEDDVTIYAEYPNGATGVFITTTGDYPGTNRFEITMDRAKIICDDEKILMQELSVPVSENINNSTKGFDVIEMKEYEVETDGLNEQHSGVLNAFAGNILHGTPLVANGIEGIKGLTISNAAHLSSWTNSEVELPFDENKFYDLLMQKVASSKTKEDVVSKVEEDMSSTF
ncbi:MAG: Gfo/Idh/MocA family oxidoreductase, partial [Ruminococcus sp.]|nr:Gfo/Idh/MocA family oxidoreductase [Candidatus Copronaster equi]